MLMICVFVAKNVNKLSNAKVVAMKVSLLASKKSKRIVTEHAQEKISKTCIPCRFRKSKPDLTQFWNFTDQLPLQGQRMVKSSSRISSDNRFREITTWSCYCSSNRKKSPVTTSTSISSSTSTNTTASTATTTTTTTTTLATTTTTTTTTTATTTTTTTTTTRMFLVTRGNLYLSLSTVILYMHEKKFRFLNLLSTLPTEDRKICSALIYHFKEQALPQEAWVQSTASDVQWWSVIYSTYVTKHVLDEVVHALLPRLFPTIRLHSPAILTATPQTTTHVFLPTDASSSSNITNTYSADGMIKKVRGSDGDHTYMRFTRLLPMELPTTSSTSALPHFKKGFLSSRVKLAN
eukprot:g15090.t1